MKLPDALIHAAIAAGAAFFGALTTAISDGALSVLNFEVALIVTGSAFFASLVVSQRLDGAADAASPPEQAP